MTNLKELKSKIEAILYANPRGISVDKIARLCGIGAKGIVKNALLELQDEYDKRGAGIQIWQNEEGLWLFRILDEYVDLARESAKPELDKAVLETLAFIAWKKKVRQSEVVKVRSNKAYEHIKELLDRGFIEAEKKSRTLVLKPTKKFYEYFQITEEELEERFKEIAGLE